ncbi:MerR family transcriptional regulator [Stutzerimonas tarimensis]|uniref:MerR family transcriptional regulator n=1 Tax=Stutzerimonas tarimensis TaxID=1507735 RepID=A0ABV7T6B7_9GAMM
MKQSEQGPDGERAGWLPIREVARLTGVNPVTLRAWERRYGLVVPRRTAKGHRLYDQDQVQRIHDILTWLNRGAAVSQVKGLLDAPQPTATDEHSPWSGLRDTQLAAVAKLAERSLDESLNDAMALYPPRTLCEHLLLPLLDALERRWQGQYGAQLERVFFYSWLRSKFGARLYHHNRQQPGAPLLLVNLSERPMEPGLWLSAWLISSVDCPVEVLDWPVPLGELRLAQERIAPRAVLLYSSQALELGLLRQLPRAVEQSPVPVVLGGAAARIHGSELGDIESLELADDPLQAFALLDRHGLFQRHAGPAP